MAVTVYPNKNGTNITFEAENGEKWSWHFNEKSNGKPLFSIKVEGGGQFVKTYDEDGHLDSQEVKPPT